MRIAIIGTGQVGRVLAAAWAGLGHEVVIGTRDPAETTSREDYAAWAGEHPGVGLASFAEAAAGAEVVVNAAAGRATLDALDSIGDALAGVVLLDTSNPLDFSQGFPPSLLIKDTDSLAEQIQRAHPQARVVKSLNTLAAAMMVDPGSLGEPTTVFVSGDDAEAKAVVTGLLTELGHQDVLDLGALETARGTEMWLPLWLRIMGALGTHEFNLKIVRHPN